MVEETGKTGKLNQQSSKWEDKPHLQFSADLSFSNVLRLETRVTADISVILQLLQRQIAPVPPAYSTVSSSTLLSDSSGLYGAQTPMLHSMYAISPIEMDNQPETQVWYQNKKHQIKKENKLINWWIFFFFFFTSELEPGLS